MTSLTDGLPSEISAQVHPDWKRNENDYWIERDALLSEYEGRWVAFDRGRVISSDASPLAVLKAAQQSGLHPFVVRVGAENEGCRIRRSAFPYDATYPGIPLPVVNAEFRAMNGTPGIVFDRVIPDTGADASALPWSDCRAMGLDPTQGTPGRIDGVSGSSAATLGFFAWVFLDGREYECQLQANFFGRERILGRDVLNCLEILFRGPSNEVVINP